MVDPGRYLHDVRGPNRRIAGIVLSVERRYVELWCDAERHDNVVLRIVRNRDLRGIDIRWRDPSPNLRGPGTPPGKSCSARVSAGDHRHFNRTLRSGPAEYAAVIRGAVRSPADNRDHLRHLAEKVKLLFHEAILQKDLCPHKVIFNYGRKEENRVPYCTC